MSNARALTARVKALEQSAKLRHNSPPIAQEMDDGTWMLNHEPYATYDEVRQACQKMQTEIKRKYDELLRIQEASRKAADKIKTNRNYSKEYIEKLLAQNARDQLAEQQRVYESVQITIQQLRAWKTQKRKRSASAIMNGS